MTNKYNNYQLCYVDNLSDCGTMELWFSKEDYTKVWGDDWDDAPYEHNAGEPYSEIKDGIKNDYIKIIINCVDYTVILAPCSHTLNSNFSVEDINIRKQIPWLRNDDFNIWAGTTLEETLSLLKNTEDLEIYYDSKLMEE